MLFYAFIMQLLFWDSLVSPVLI